jgi:hypothetical protein
LPGSSPRSAHTAPSAPTGGAIIAAARTDSCKAALRARTAQAQARGIFGAPRFFVDDETGFKAGTGNAHRLLNETDTEATYLEIGDRTAGDAVDDPEDDLQAIEVDGAWRFPHKDGSPY